MRAALACLALSCAAPVAAWAGAFEVNPIRVDLSPAVRSAAVTVRNSGADAVVVQASVQAWSQQDGKDVLAPTSEVLVSPPIATIAPDQEQVIRIGLRRAPDAQHELSYRLFVQEVPPPPQPGFQGLQVALRVGLPVFVEPRTGPAKATLVWDAQMRTPDSVSLKVANKGTGHIQISEVAMYLPGGKDPVAAHSSLAYVLPGQSREWDLALKQRGINKTDRLRLKVSTDSGSVDTEIGLGP